MSGEKKRRQIAQIIWTLEGDGNKVYSAVNMDGSGSELMVGLKEILNELVTTMTEELQGSSAALRSMLLKWLANDEITIEEEDNE